MADKKKSFDYSYTQNRELSWLTFNDRVLAEAADKKIPLLERLKFVSIFTSNLDEFFMIRVGSLWDLSLLKNQRADNKSGMSPRKQLDKIYAAVKPLYKKRDEIYLKILETLSLHYVVYSEVGTLAKKDKKFVQDYFRLNLLPVLSPLIIGVHHPCPHFINKQLYVMASLEISGKKKYGIVPVPASTPRVVYLPGKTVRFVLVEDVICEFLKIIFDKYKILQSVVISVTRNADINPDDEGYEVDEDYRHHIINILKKRKRLAPVRLEYQKAISPEILRFLLGELRLMDYQCFCSQIPLTLGFAFTIEEQLPSTTINSITYPPFIPQPSAMLEEDKPILPQIAQKDVLLSFPYETMEGFLKLLKEASVDPDVISIKIAIYRMAKQGKLLKYLCDAAENNKDVVVIMELRARFDEESNIEWADILEESGCQIFYGFTGYKVHSKICLITRRGSEGMEYYTQIGTGNYNEKTVKMYTDVSLITANRGIGNDASVFFKNMAISNLNGNYNYLLVAPYGIKTKFLELIEEEIQKAKNGLPARILIKINSFSERDIIDALQRASDAGVEVKMIIRGICCMLPNITGKTDNIEIISIVGRYLEHTRFYCFGTDDDTKVYISSADLMTRNLSRRVEIACPIMDNSIKNSILHTFDILWQDSVKARTLSSTGKYITKECDETFNAQEYFTNEAKNTALGKNVSTEDLNIVPEIMQPSNDIWEQKEAQYLMQIQQLRRQIEQLKNKGRREAGFFPRYFKYKKK